MNRGGVRPEVKEKGRREREGRGKREEGRDAW